MATWVFRERLLSISRVVMMRADTKANANGTERGSSKLQPLTSYLTLDLMNNTYAYTSEMLAVAIFIVQTCRYFTIIRCCSNTFCQA